MFFEKKFQGIFLQKKFVKRFPCKFEAEFQGWFFFSRKKSRDFPVKLKMSQINFKGIFLLK